MSLENATNGTTKKIIPISLGFEDEMLWGGVIARSNTYASASPEGPYNPSQRAQIQIPPNLVDLHGATLQFKCTGTPGAGAGYARFNQSISSVIERLTVSIGSRVVLDSQNYNVLKGLNQKKHDVNWRNLVLAVVGGGGTQTKRGNEFADPNKVYAIQLYNFHTDFLHGVFPLQKVSAPMYINIYFAPANTVIESDVPGGTYVVNDLQFHYSSLVPTPQWDNMYDQKLSSGRLPTFAYEAFEASRDTNSCLAGITSLNKDLNFKKSSLTGVICVFRKSADLTNPAINNKIDGYVYPNITSASIRIGGISYPSDQDTNGSDLFVKLMEYYGESLQDQPTYFGQNWDGTGSNEITFALAFPLKKSPYQLEDDRILSQGLDVSISVAMQMQLQFGAPLANNLTMDIFARHNDVLVFNRNGSISLYD